jgi:hypothetical protein
VSYESGVFWGSKLMRNKLTIVLTVAWIFAISVVIAQPPEPLFENYGCYWNGEGKLILITPTVDGEHAEAYALELGSPKLTYLSHFDTSESPIIFINDNLNYIIDADNFILSLRNARYFDFKNETYNSPDTRGSSVVNYSLDTQDFSLITKRTMNFDTRIFEKRTYSGEIINEIFRTELGSDSTTLGSSVKTGESFILFGASTFLGSLLPNVSEVYEINFTNPESPQFNQISGSISSDFIGIPCRLSGLSGSIARYRPRRQNTVMGWIQLYRNQVVREFDTGIRWVSHNINGSTGEAYYTDNTRVVEDPTSSGIYFTELPIVASTNNYTSRTEFAFRIAHPSELPEPSDYINHLTGVTEQIAGCPFPERKRVNPRIFKDPDRNGDGQIDVADLVTRVNEINDATRRIPTRK